MKAAVESYKGTKLLRSCIFPGAVACCEENVPAAWLLQQELHRITRCYRWLPKEPAVVFTVSERTFSQPGADPQHSSTLFAYDLEKTPEELQQLLRLLRESTALLERCCRSFPDMDYDYMEGEPHPAWQPASGREGLRYFLAAVRQSLRRWQLPEDALPDQEWKTALDAILDSLEKREAFMQNRLFYTPQGFCCAAQWLRTNIELCHLTGRRLYELGVASFGRDAIEDSFGFEMIH
ncbi:MAG: hypothetical protein IJ412_03360 [Oscillospiraceae bacterium]|nr:hypothetical protein [Oscillospiraceae bacterium]